MDIYIRSNAQVIIHYPLTNQCVHCFYPRRKMTLLDIKNDIPDIEEKNSIPAEIKTPIHLSLGS